MKFIYKLNLIFFSLFLSSDSFAFIGKDLMRVADRLGLEAEQGQGTVNGTSQVMTGLFGVLSPDLLYTALRNDYDGRYTITKEWSPYGTVIVVAKIFSPRCTSCPKPTTKNLEQIMANAYTLTIQPSQGSFMAFGSKTGDIYKNRNKVQAYNGEWLTYLAIESEVQAHSEFKFAKTTTRQLTGEFIGTKAEAFALVSRSMSNQGYTRIFADNENEGSMSHWRKDDRVTRILISPPNQGRVGWQAYEVNTP